MKLWCDIMAHGPNLKVADAAVKAFDKTFPPPEPDTRFDRLVQWIRDNSHRDGNELTIDARVFEQLVKEI